MKPSNAKVGKAVTSPTGYKRESRATGIPRSKAYAGKPILPLFPSEDIRSRNPPVRALAENVLLKPDGKMTNRA